MLSRLKLVFFSRSIYFYLLKYQIFKHRVRCHRCTTWWMMVCLCAREGTKQSWNSYNWMSFLECGEFWFCFLIIVQIIFHTWKFVQIFSITRGILCVRVCACSKVFNVVSVQTEAGDLHLEQITKPEPKSSFIAQVRDHFSQFEWFDSNWVEQHHHYKASSRRVSTIIQQ